MISFSYGHLLVATGDIAFLNGVSSVLITGKGPKLYGAYLEGGAPNNSKVILFHYM